MEYGDRITKTDGVPKGVVRRKILENRYVTLVARLILSATFFVSSLGKLVDVEKYSVAVVYNFDILPNIMAIAFGWALPFIELTCAVSLLFGILTRLSALGTSLLGTSFFAAKAILLSKGVDINCGCFGALATTMASWSIYLDPAIFVMSLTILFSSRTSRRWMSVWQRLPEKWRDRLDVLW